MITKIEIDGFKTFEDFSMVFSPFVIIAGTNGSGKSNLFDAIRLLSSLAEKDLTKAFEDQRGQFNELFTLYSSDTRATKIKFAVELFLDTEIEDEYKVKADLFHRRFRYELHIALRKDDRTGLERLYVEYELLKAIKTTQDKWAKQFLKLDEWDIKKTGGNYQPYIEPKEKNGEKIIYIRQDGKKGGKPTPIRYLERSALSGVTDATFPHTYAVREEMRNWKQFQLNPRELGKPSSMLGSNIMDIEGKYLAAMINRIQSEEPLAINSISRNVHQLLPEIKRIFIDNDTSRQQYILMIESTDGRVFSSNVLSEGTLRIIALVALRHDERHKGLICFEEPENGIHPYRMNKILHILKSLTTDFDLVGDSEYPLRQVLINTHSPLLIKEIHSNSDFKNVLIYFSRLAIKIDSSHNSSYKLTRLSAVKNDNYKRLFLNEIPAEEAITHHELMDYLNFFDGENTSNTQF